MGNCQKLRYRIIRKTKLGASNYEIVDILEKISEKKIFPPEIQSVLIDSCMNIMDAKLKREISEYFPRLKRIHKQKKYWKNARNITTELFLKLPHKYIKGFLVFLEQDTYILDKPNILAFNFLLNHLDDLIRYIGNRKESIHNDVFDFIICFYGAYGIEPPSQFNFRDIIYNVTEYFFTKEIVDIENRMLNAGIIENENSI